MIKLNTDWAEQQQGDYIAVNNVWGKYSLGFVPNYTQSISIDNELDLSSGIHMDWNWEVDTSNNKVLAYPEISVGYKPWDDPSHGTSSLSTRIQDIKTFSVSHDLAIGGDTTRFNVSYDLWLTNTPLGDENTITTELMVWTHKGGPDDFGSSAIVGTYTQQGTTFDIVKYDGFTTGGGLTWRYIALVPQTDILDKTVNLKQVFYDLIDRGLISDKDYVTGYELGAEVTGGLGSLTINHMSHDLDTYGADSRANILIGTRGEDRIYALGGSDTLKGKAGNDFLAGGFQSDTLTGGTGRDTFYFNDLGKGVDVIVDFQPGRDVIGIEADIFTAFTVGESLADSFRTGRHFGADTHLLYRNTTGQLFYDADGSGNGAAAHLIATLENHTKLTYSDFEVL